MQSEETVKLLGVTLDYKLNFDPHISHLCKKAAEQLNVLKRLKSFISFAEKEVLVQSFVYSNFNCCPLVWYFSSSKSLQKIERIQERALRFLYHDHKSSYDDLLTRSKNVQCFLLVREPSVSNYSRQLEEKIREMYPEPQPFEFRKVNSGEIWDQINKLNTRKAS